MARKFKLEGKSGRNRSATNYNDTIMTAPWLAFFAITHIVRTTYILNSATNINR